MRHGSLFSGIGGFDLAAEWMAWENVFHCEWNEFGKKVLKYYWPNAISYHDITKTDFTIHRGSIDILTGGFPCQPYSAAGKRLGKEDERHLWPEMLRAIREIQPTWIVGENVLGLVNWNGGLVFEEVQADLEAEGYEIQPYVLPACAVNAPHRRDRVWFVAFNAKSSRNSKVGKVCEGKNNESIGIRNSNIERSSSNTESMGWRGRGCETRDKWEDIIQQPRNQRLSEIGVTSDTSSNGLHEQPTEKDKREWENNQQSGSQRISTAQRPSNEWNATDTEIERLEREGRKGIRSSIISTQSWIRNWDSFPTQSPICSGNDGISTRLDRITFPKWRNESIKAGGNAVVPQVVYQIFKSIEQYDKEKY